MQFLKYIEKNIFFIVKLLEYPIQWSDKPKRYCTEAEIDKQRRKCLGLFGV